MTVPTLVPLLAARAAAQPDRCALAMAGGASRLTFAQWQARSGAVAGGLRERGVRRGDRVALCFPAAGWVDYAVAFLGVLRAGAVAVPLSTRTAPAVLAEMLADAGAAGLVTDGAAVPAPVAWTLGVAELEAAAAGPDGPEPAPGDLAQILFTSGTTGRAKGVAATHANLGHGLGGRRRPFAHSEHLAHAFPIGTNAGQQMLLHALDATPTVVTLPQFTPLRFAAMVRDHGAGTVFVVPAMAIELLNADVGALPSVRLLGSAAAPLPAAVSERLRAVVPNATIVNYYTSTEAAPAQTVMVVDPARPGSVGQAVAGGEVRIATAEGVPLPPGEPGEVWLRCPTAPRSYLGEPDSAVFRDGWVRMGDLGRMDEDGYLHLIDRTTDVIKSGALKVSTLHVEEAIHAHPEVVEAAAFGVPHPVLGAVVVAATVVRHPVSDVDLRGFLRTRLAPEELPARFVHLDALPRNASGKVDKRALIERFAA